jgi:hypothetical protein
MRPSWRWPRSSTKWAGFRLALVGLERVQFLYELQHYHVPMIDLDADELSQDIANA